MVVKLTNDELLALTYVVDDSNNQEVRDIFLAIFGKKHLPEFKVTRTKEFIEVDIPQNVSMNFLKVLDAHAVRLGVHIRNRSIFKILNELKNMGSDLARVFKRG